MAGLPPFLVFSTLFHKWCFRKFLSLSLYFVLHFDYLGRSLCSIWSHFGFYFIKITSLLSVRYKTPQKKNTAEYRWDPLQRHVPSRSRTRSGKINDSRIAKQQLYVPRLPNGLLFSFILVATNCIFQ